MMNRDDPDTWTEADWNAYDDALDRLCSLKADQFARDLDRLGWKIVLQEPGDIGWIFAVPAIVDAPLQNRSNRGQFRILDRLRSQAGPDHRPFPSN
jgi:hypothetical protein